MKYMLLEIYKILVYLVGFFFLGAILVAVSQGILIEFGKYVFGQELWHWWVACSILGGIVYWLWKVFVYPLAHKDDAK
jgi:hypothetical protein